MESFSFAVSLLLFTFVIGKCLLTLACLVKNFLTFTLNFKHDQNSQHVIVFGYGFWSMQSAKVCSYFLVVHLYFFHR